MSVIKNDPRQFVTVAIDRRQWRGLKFEADLLTQVFGTPITPQGVLQKVVEGALQPLAGRSAL